MSTGVLFVHLEGTRPSAAESDLITHPLVAGVVLFERNYEDRCQLQTMVDALRKKRADLIVGVDHEGGRVQRFRRGFTQIPSMRELARVAKAYPDRGDMLLSAVGWLLATELLEVGIDLNLGPVLDLDHQKCSVIGERSFDRCPERVIHCARLLIQGMRSAGMAAVGKHFPGHGCVNGDSHFELPQDDRSLAALERSDLRPFIELKNELAAVMTAHILYPAIDPEVASFSHYWLNEILRQHIGFNGVILTDDLLMVGACGISDPGQRLCRAWDAGADVALWCHEAEVLIPVLNKLEKCTADKPVLDRVANLRSQNNFDASMRAGWQDMRKKLVQDIVESLHGKMADQVRMAELVAHF